MVEVGESGCMEGGDQCPKAGGTWAEYGDIPSGRFLLLCHRGISLYIGAQEPLGVLRKTLLTPLRLLALGESGMLEHPSNKGGAVLVGIQMWRELGKGPRPEI